MRIGVVDDDTVLAACLARAVAAAPGFRLIGVAESLAAGIELVTQGIDVLLVDLRLPDGSGLDLITLARERGARKVLVLSVFGDGRTVIDAIERGADGYLLKDAAAPDVVAAIHAVLEGGAPMSPAVAAHILSRVRAPAAADRGEGATRRAVTLTPKELMVLEQLAKGLSFKDIALAEGISYHTVVGHVKVIYRKLSVHSRGEAVFEALSAGLINVRE